MTNIQRSALFWVFLALFTLIALISLLVALGLFPDADPAFRKVAIGTFVAGVGGDMLVVFRGAFAPRPALFITLAFEGKQPQELNLERAAKYEVWQQGKVVRSGTIGIEGGRQGGWVCPLPDEIDVRDRIRLVLREESDSEWEWVVPFFAFNFNHQTAVRRRQQGSGGG